MLMSKVTLRAATHNTVYFLTTAHEIFLDLLMYGRQLCHSEIPQHSIVELAVACHYVSTGPFQFLRFSIGPTKRNVNHN